MDVQLYVYDLSKGLARVMSMGLVGIQIDAVYHTSIVLGGIEYFYGAGVQTCFPGQTHHGQPMEIINLGKTELPMDVVLTYLESSKEQYTHENYDLFTHNCNNFTHDFSVFLLGKGIPDHITNLPSQVLNTPFGAMMKNQLDQSMRNVTQAAVPPERNPTHPRKLEVRDESRAADAHGSVRNIIQPSVLEGLLNSAKDSCAVVFFTSSTCAPCKIAYPTYDLLASEYPKVPFIKVDTNQAQEIAMKYQIRATPTFMTFLHGQKDNEWSGANPSQLRGNVELLIQQAFPPHPHLQARAPVLQFGSLKPVTFSKIPPLDKLTAKMGDKAKDPVVVGLKTFLTERGADGSINAPLPDLPAIARFMRSAPSNYASDTLFTAYDLMRCALLDPRVSGWFAEESAPGDSETLSFMFSHVLGLINDETCPYNLRLVTIQLAGNLFTWPLFAKTLLNGESQGLISSLITKLACESLLAEPDKPAIRAAASSLAFNLAATNYRIRREEEREALPEASQVELAASLLELLSTESPAEKGRGVNPDLLKSAVTAFGYLIYCAPKGGELADLCSAMDAKHTIEGLQSAKEVEKVAKEIVEVLGKEW
ncbi:PPPDE putative peptidase domain-containing protein [Delphinella strobiligena]|nr:PPPDE putative peptidase domain-containing protein [Delphinella strobiligena]